MTFIPWPNGIQLCFDFTMASQLWQFCLALRKSAGAPTSTDLSNIAAAAKTWWQGDPQDWTSDGCTLRQVRTTDMTAQGAPQYIETVNETGTNGSADLPLNAAVVVSERTAKRGRSYRGRAYTGGFTQDVMSTATDIGSLSAAGIVTAFLDLQTTLDALGFDMVVPTRQHNGSPVNPAELNEVIAFVVDTHIDSQRRRLAGRGT